MTTVPVEVSPPKPMPFADFLIGIPALERRLVTVKVERQSNSSLSATLTTPELELYCRTCGGPRFFDAENLSLYQFNESFFGDRFLDYTCRNCHKQFKTYALQLYFESFRQIAQVTKYGEAPAFGQPRPNAIRDVLDDEMDFFEKGYRAETSGLGIGAYAYYRRFVESHKDKIIAEIRKVAVVQGAKADVLATLDRAATINSFENAFDMVKDAIPDSLRLPGGHSPLTLLHGALSEGLHSEEDAQCLELAKDIRLLLTDLSERTTQALKNNAELTDSVKKLLRKATAKAERRAALPAPAADPGKAGG